MVSSSAITNCKSSVLHHDYPLSKSLFPSIDMSDLWPKLDRKTHGADVLNGISISKDEGVLYITGKKWNRMYRLKFEGL